MFNVLKDKLGNILNPIIPRYERLTRYSTDEVKTGEKWIDGKDIYRKVIDKTIIFNSYSIIFDTIQNVDTMINIYGRQHTTLTGWCGNIDTVHLPSNGYCRTVFNYTNGQVSLDTSTNDNAQRHVVIVCEYTKK